MPEPSPIKGTIAETERIGLRRASEFTRTGSAYALEQATRPSTLGFALASSSIALLAWYVLIAVASSLSMSLIETLP